MNDTFNLVRELFWEALDVAEPEQRRLFVEQRCQNEPALLAELQKMLDAHEQSGGFLEEQERDNSASAEQQALDPDQVENLTGQRIRGYLIREQLGEGGMGTVYVAEQSQPVQRKVALKVIRPGMATSDVLGRFQAERQALAMMDHPNIASIHDAGTTPQGLPFFAMELVRGAPITEYADEYRLSTQARLRLFQSVCNAVQHAHLKGIIHRDLKPNNVLVTRIDGEDVVKVIDFGVAKATSQRLTEKSVYTRHTQVIGTPMYMSPEQAQFSGTDVDTRSDVYSLGVLLYRLLSGRSPFESSRFAEANLEEVRRIIREETPPLPSEQVSTLEAEARTTLSNQHRSAPERIVHALRGELDWIVMKAMDKDRDRRYESASALAADIDRYLSGDPVLACPPSKWYQLKKRFQRHRLVTTSAACIILCMLTAIVGITHEAFRANKAEGLAEERLGRIKEEQGRTIEALSKAESAEELQRTLRLKAEQSERETKWHLFAAKMYPVRQAFEDRDFRRLDGLLKDLKPSAGDADYRGWEYQFLKSQVDGASTRLSKQGDTVSGPIDWSNATRKLATGVGSNKVGIWSGSPLSIEYSIELDSKCMELSFDPKGKLLAMGLNNGELVVADVARREIVYRSALFRTKWSKMENEFARHLHSIDWSFDSRLLAVGDWWGSVATLNLQTQELNLLLDPPERVTCVSLSWHPKKMWLAVGLRGGVRRVYDLISGESWQHADKDMNWAYGMTWSPDGERLAFQHTNAIQITDAWGKNAIRLADRNEQFQDCVWVSNDEVAASSIAGNCYVWSVSEQQITREIHLHAAKVYDIAFDTHTRQLVSAGPDTSVLLTPLQEAEPYTSRLIKPNFYGLWRSASLRKHKDDLHFGASSMEWSPDGSKLAIRTVVKPNSENFHSSILTVFDSSLEHAFFSRDVDFAKGMAWSHDSTAIFLRTNDCIFVRDAATGDVIQRRVEEHLGEPQAHWSPSAQWMVTYGGRAIRRFFDQSSHLEWEQPFGVGLARWNRDEDRFILVHYHDYNTRLLSMDGSSRTLNGTTTDSSAAWHPSGELITIGDKTGKIRHVRPDTQEVLITRSAHRGEIRDIDYSPDGARIATCGFDGMIHIWDASTSDRLLTLRVPVRSNDGNRVRWSRDGRKLVATNGTHVFMWKIPEKTPSTTPEYLASARLPPRSDPNGWVSTVASPPWKRWYSRFRSAAVVMVPGTDTSRQDSELSAVLESAVSAESEEPALRAMQFLIESIADNSRALNLIDQWMAVLDESDKVSELAWRLHQLRLLRMKTLRLENAGKIPFAIHSVSVALERSEELLENGNVDDEIWRLCLSVHIDALRLSANQYATALSQVTSGEEESSRERQLRLQLRETLDQCLRFEEQIPSSAYFMKRTREGTGKTPAWFFSALNDVSKQEIRLGRPASCLEEWQETFNLRSYYGHQHFNGALCKLLRNDQAGYRDICRNLMHRISSQDKPQDIADELTTLCLQPDALDSYSKALRVAEHARQSVADNLTWPTRCLAALQYRSGHFDEALQTLQELKEMNPDSWATAGYFLAMTQHRLGRRKDAKESLRTAQQHLEALNLLADEEQWSLLLRCRFLNDEANQLIHQSIPADAAP